MGVSVHPLINLPFFSYDSLDPPVLYLSPPLNRDSSRVVRKGSVWVEQMRFFPNKIDVLNELTFDCWRVSETKEPVWLTVSIHELSLIQLVSWGIERNYEPDPQLFRIKSGKFYEDIHPVHSYILRFLTVVGVFVFVLFGHRYFNCRFLFVRDLSSSYLGTPVRQGPCQ